MPRKVIELKDSLIFTHLIFCPACGCGHGFNTDPVKRPDAIWGYNNDPEKPTLQGSILVRSGGENGQTICHSFITNGMIQYLSDCTHELVGQTVELDNYYYE